LYSPKITAAANKKRTPLSTGRPGGIPGPLGGGGAFLANVKFVKAKAKTVKILFGTILIGCKSK